MLSIHRRILWQDIILETWINDHVPTLRRLGRPLNPDTHCDWSHSVRPLEPPESQAEVAFTIRRQTDLNLQH